MKTVLSDARSRYQCFLLPVPINFFFRQRRQNINKIRKKNPTTRISYKKIIDAIKVIAFDLLERCLDVSSLEKFQLQEVGYTCE